MKIWAILATMFAISLCRAQQVEPAPAKLNHVIPAIDWKETPAEQAIAFIAQQSGVRIIIDPSAANIKGMNLTISLRNIPAMEALKYVAALTNVKFWTNDTGVLVVALTKEARLLLTRRYDGINPQMIGLDSANSTSFRSVFIGSGVKFPNGSSVTYASGQLTVIDTADELRAVDDIVGKWKGIAPEPESPASVPVAPATASPQTPKGKIPGIEAPAAMEALLESNKYAVSIYPDAGDANTPLGKECRRIIELWSRTRSDIMARNDSPQIVVVKAAMNLGIVPATTPKNVFDDAKMRSLISAMEAFPDLNHGDSELAKEYLSVMTRHGNDRIATSSDAPRLVTIEAVQNILNRARENLRQQQITRMRWDHIKANVFGMDRPSDQDVQAVLTDYGLTFPPGASVRYSKSLETVDITNTEENITKFSQFLTDAEADRRADILAKKERATDERLYKRLNPPPLPDQSSAATAARLNDLEQQLFHAQHPN